MRAAAIIGLVLMGSPLRAESYPIAGLAPSRRPEGAPAITALSRPAGWEAKFFRGVEKPYPPSLSWSADQGGWYTPFDQPGMPGRYDIRNLHAVGRASRP